METRPKYPLWVEYAAYIPLLGAITKAIVRAQSLHPVKPAPDSISVLAVQHDHAAREGARLSIDATTDPHPRRNGGTQTIRGR